MKMRTILEFLHFPKFKNKIELFIKGISYFHEKIESFVENSPFNAQMLFAFNIKHMGHFPDHQYFGLFVLNFFP